MEAYQKFLVPTDFSLASELSLKTVSAQALLNDAHVTLLYVVVVSPFAPVTKDPQTEKLTMEPDAKKTVMSELKRLRTEHLAEVKHVNCDVLVARNAAFGICDYAKEGGHDLIIMPKRGESGLARALIGSVTEKVVRHARCGVLTFRTAAYD